MPVVGPSPQLPPHRSLRSLPPAHIPGSKPKGANPFPCLRRGLSGSGMAASPRLHHRPRQSRHGTCPPGQGRSAAGCSTLTGGTEPVSTGVWVDGEGKAGRGRPWTRRCQARLDSVLAKRCAEYPRPLSMNPSRPRRSEGPAEREGATRNPRLTVWRAVCPAPAPASGWRATKAGATVTPTAMTY
jgi:hypothetical protein